MSVKLSAIIRSKISFSQLFLRIFSNSGKGRNSLVIKGVNRQVVEVTQTQCEYFEKVIFFIKPEFSTVSEGTLRERASLIAESATPPPPTKIKRRKLIAALKLAAAALSGAAVTGIIGSLLM